MNIYRITIEPVLGGRIETAFVAAETEKEAKSLLWPRLEEGKKIANIEIVSQYPGIPGVLTA
jgi:hypothetical protein